MALLSPSVSAKYLSGRDGLGNKVLTTNSYFEGALPPPTHLIHHYSKNALFILTFLVFHSFDCVLQTS